MKSLLAALLLIPSFAFAEARPGARIEVPSIVRFHCLPDVNNALAFGGGSMSAWGTVTVDKHFETTQISSTATVQQARVTARISYNAQGGVRKRDIRVSGNIRIWKGYPGKPQINLFLNPGSIQVSVGEIIGDHGIQTGIGNITSMSPMICHNQLF